MTKEADLIKLEGIVTNLMERYNTLKQQNLEQVIQLKAKDEMIAELNNDIELLHDEKTTVHGRVSNLIGSIEEWERANDDDGATALSMPAIDNSNEQPEGESKLFDHCEG